MTQSSSNNSDIISVDQDNMLLCDNANENLLSSINEDNSLPANASYNHQIQLNFTNTVDKDFSSDATHCTAVEMERGSRESTSPSILNESLISRQLLNNVDEQPFSTINEVSLDLSSTSIKPILTSALGTKPGFKSPPGSVSRSAWDGQNKMLSSFSRVSNAKTTDISDVDPSKILSNNEPFSTLLSQSRASNLNPKTSLSCSSSSPSRPCESSSSSSLSLLPPPSTSDDLQSLHIPSFINSSSNGNNISKNQDNNSFKSTEVANNKRPDIIDSSLLESSSLFPPTFTTLKAAEGDGRLNHDRSDTVQMASISNNKFNNMHSPSFNSSNPITTSSNVASISYPLNQHHQQQQQHHTSHHQHVNHHSAHHQSVRNPRVSSSFGLLGSRNLATVEYAFIPRSPPNEASSLFEDRIHHHFQLAGLWSGFVKSSIMGLPIPLTSPRPAETEPILMLPLSINPSSAVGPLLNKIKQTSSSIVSHSTNKIKDDVTREDICYVPLLSSCQIFADISRPVANEIISSKVMNILRSYSQAMLLRLLPQYSNVAHSPSLIQSLHEQIAPLAHAAGEVMRQHLEAQYDQICNNAMFEFVDNRPPHVRPPLAIQIRSLLESNNVKVSPNVFASTLKLPQDTWCRNLARVYLEASNEVNAKKINNEDNCANLGGTDKSSNTVLNENAGIETNQIVSDVINQELNARRSSIPGSVESSSSSSSSGAAAASSSQPSSSDNKVFSSNSDLRSAGYCVELISRLLNRQELLRQHSLIGYPIPSFDLTVNTLMQTNLQQDQTTLFWDSLFKNNPLPSSELNINHHAVHTHNKHVQQHNNAANQNNTALKSPFINQAPSPMPNHFPQESEPLTVVDGETNPVSPETPLGETGNSAAADPISSFIDLFPHLSQISSSPQTSACKDACEGGICRGDVRWLLANSSSVSSKSWFSILWQPLPSKTVGSNQAQSIQPCPFLVFYKFRLEKPSADGSCKLMHIDMLPSRASPEMWNRLRTVPCRPGSQEPLADFKEGDAYELKEFVAECVPDFDASKNNLTQFLREMNFDHHDFDFFSRKVSLPSLHHSHIHTVSTAFASKIPRVSNLSMHRRGSLPEGLRSHAAETETATANQERFGHASGSKGKFKPKKNNQPQSKSAGGSRRMV